MNAVHYEKIVVKEKRNMEAIKEYWVCIRQAAFITGMDHFKISKLVKLRNVKIPQVAIRAFQF